MIALSWGKRESPYYEVGIFGNIIPDFDPKIAKCNIDYIIKE
jgi:hypothetical protein